MIGWCWLFFVPPFRARGSRANATTVKCGRWNFLILLNRQPLEFWTGAKGTGSMQLSVDGYMDENPQINFRRHPFDRG